MPPQDFMLAASVKIETDIEKSRVKSHAQEIALTVAVSSYPAVDRAMACDGRATPG